MYRYQEFGQEKKKYLPWKLFVGSFVFVLLCFGFYFFSENYYVPKLKKENQVLKDEINSLSKEIDLKERQEVIKFWSQIRNLETLLASHIYVTKLLEKIEALVPQEIKFRTLRINLEGGFIEIEGVGKREEVARYVVALEESKEFFDVKLGRVEEENFSLKANFDPELIKF